MTTTDKRIEVLIIFSAGELGGAERSLTRMALANGDKGVVYRIATIGGEGEWARWARSQGIEPAVYSIRGTLRSSLVECQRFLGKLREHRFEVIYVVGLRAAVLVRLARPLLGNVRVVHGIRSSFPKDSKLAATFRWPERVLKRLTSAYITNSDAGAATLAVLANIPRREIHVIPNGIEVENYGRRSNADRNNADRNNVVAVVANLHPLKGHLQFLDVVELVRNRYPEVRFKFVGRDDLNGQVQAEVARRTLTNVVQFCGFQDNIVPVLQDSALFVLPSQITEGAPTSILEAMAAELPVVAYAVGGVPELVRDGIDGSLICAGDAKRMAEAIVALLLDRDRSASMGKAARAKVESDFSVERCASRHAVVWRQLCDL